MKVVRATDFEFELRDAWGRAMGVGRAPGLHLGHVLNYLEKHGLGKTYTGEGNDLWAATGFMFEVMLSSAFAKYLLQDRDHVVIGKEYRAATGSRVKGADSMALNPDGYDTVVDRIEECKATWRSANKFRHAAVDGGLSLHTYAWRWLAQIKTYCRRLETPRARLYVLFIMGDYCYGRPSKNNPEPLPAGPSLQVFDLEFTPAELDANWRMVTLHAEMAAREAGVIR